MKVKIHSNSKYGVTPAMREYVENAIFRLEEIVPEDSTITCSCKSVNRDKGFEIMVTNKEYQVRAETHCDDFYDAVDKSVDKVIKSARKYHHKLLDIKKRVKKNNNVYSELKENYKDEEYKKNIVRIKEASAVAMSVESALLQMETLDYDFFLFLDNETLQPCAVYKRKEEGYGLIKLTTLVE